MVALANVNHIGDRLLKYELANRLSRSSFYATYVQPLLSTTPADDFIISFETSGTLSDSDFDACFNLLETTSAAHYKRSRNGWSPKHKRVEMRDPLMKYLVLRKRELQPELVVNTASKDVIGFVSFMLTEEDDLEVIYCYEIHVDEQVRGRGLGRTLMQLMEAVGAAVPVEKAMLTVFASNAKGKAFHESLGYEYYDEEPAPPRKKLRTRTTETLGPSYYIMAKDIGSSS